MLVLDSAEAEALTRLGRGLAGNSAWWGANLPAAPGDAASVITCTPLGGDRWRVRVQDAVGLISLVGRQIEVKPKIPVPHLIHLFRSSTVVPRTVDDHARASGSDDLWQLVAQWFVGSIEVLLRKGLLRDYQEEIDSISTLRGTVDVLSTAQAFYSGQLLLTCAFDEFSHDSAMNRVLRAAAKVVMGSPELDPALRTRARRSYWRMEDVSELQPADARMSPDRRHHYYVDAWVLARHVLASLGRSASAGEVTARSFLIRTPELIEEGIRNILRDELVHWEVTKRGVAAAGSTITFNPDLVFQRGAAVGDVKYKLVGTEWRRPDLYQSVAFAAAYRSRFAVVVGFSQGDHQLVPVQAGDIEVVNLNWNIGAEVNPAQAAERLALDIQHWLSRCLEDEVDVS